VKIDSAQERFKYTAAKAPVSPAIDPFEFHEGSAKFIGMNESSGKWLKRMIKFEPLEHSEQSESNTAIDSQIHILRS
jgi:hypothetical protein